MAQQTKKPRRSIFPAYEPSGDDPMAYAVAHFTAIGKRIVLLATLVSVATAAASYLGIQMSGPQQTERRVKAVEDSIAATNKRVTDLEGLVRGNIYVSCQTLALVQPANAVKPEQCGERGRP